MASDPTGRFNIGESFLQLKQEEAKQEDTTPPSPQPTTPTPNEPDPDKYCEICNISVTSQPQMKVHLEGAKHAKKLKAIGQYNRNTVW